MAQLTSGNSAVPLVPAKPAKDYILHVSVGPSPGELTFRGIMPSDSFVFEFKNFLSILLDIIKEQGRQLEFDGFYISYLLGTLTQDELDEAAKTFVTEATVTTAEAIKDRVGILHALRGHDISVREMAQYLHCDEEAVVKALQLLQK